MSSSDFFTHAQIAALHRETYTSALKGLLPWGTAKSFAEQAVGITPVYLSNLLDPYHNPPSPQIAERIVSTLPLDSDQRLGLLEHMLLAREEFQRSEDLISSDMKQDYREGHNSLRGIYDQVLSAQASEDYSRFIVSLRDTGKTVIKHLSPRQAGLAFVETCLVLHYAQSSLNRWEDALFYTRLGEAVLHSLDPSSENIEGEWFRHLQVNLLCAKASAYRNLNLPKQALESVNEASYLMETTANAQRAIWLPAAYREKINILARLPRFSLAEIEGLADQIRAICDARSTSSDALLLLVDRSLINAWTTYRSSRSLKRARTRLRTRLEDLDTLSSFGPLQTTMFLQSAAKFYWHTGQYDEWRHSARILVSIARTANLRHQMSQARREFGSALDQLSS